MVKVIRLENKNIYHIFAISGIILLLIVFLFEPVCIFKNVFGIRCISCGLTRGIVSLLQFNFKEAFSYNILSIPMFIFIISFYILYVLYILNINKFLDKIYYYFVRYYKMIIVLLCLCWIFNIFYLQDLH